jgi:5-methyltetrahydropteroyltriglutamate--homocysteine methyltransferase
MQVRAYVHGLYPRSEELVAATRDLERGRTTEQAVEDQRRKDAERLARLQEEAGLDLRSDGLLWWQDIFRVLVDATSGLEAGALVRWFDNNTFFRAPVVSGPLEFDPEAARLTADGVDGNQVATLPSPYMFSRASDSSNAVMLELARHVVRPAAEYLVSQGCGLIHLEEPWLVYYGIEDGDWEHFSQALAIVAEDLGAPVVLHTYYGDSAPIQKRLNELPVAAIGVDLVETDLGSLERGWKLGLVAGCINGRNTVLESADASAELVRRAADATEAPMVFLAPASELELLPEAVARRKVLLLSEVAGKVKEQVR